MESEVIHDVLVENETIKTIYSRRAVRKYKDKPVDHALIEQILDAGRMAPSAINKQPWKFYVFTNKEKIAELSKEAAKGAAKSFFKSGIKEIVKTAASVLHFPHKSDFTKGDNSIFHGAPVVIFITSPKDNDWAQLDVGMCSQNIMLAAKALGLDSCPVGMGKFIEKSKLYPSLNIPDTEQIDLSIILGYGDENPELHPRVKNSAVYFS